MAVKGKHGLWSPCWQSSTLIDLRASEQGETAASSRHSAGILYNVCMCECESVCAEPPSVSAICTSQFIPEGDERMRWHTSRAPAGSRPVGGEKREKKTRAWWARRRVAANAEKTRGLPGGMWHARVCVH